MENPVTKPDNLITRVQALGEDWTPYVRLSPVYVEPQLLAEAAVELANIVNYTEILKAHGRPNALEKLAYIVLRETVNL